jgi:hypothetical protein
MVWVGNSKLETYFFSQTKMLAFLVKLTFLAMISIFIADEFKKIYFLTRVHAFD